jgi:hypothetical protein
VPATTDWVRGGTVTALLTAALLAAGCGGSEPPSGAAATPSPSPGREAYLECLRRNGVEPGGNAGKPGAAGNGASAAPDEGTSAAPDESGGAAAGEGGKGRAGSPELRKARRACRSLAPRANPARVAALKAFRECMKRNGASLPGKGAKKDENQDETGQNGQDGQEGAKPGDPEYAAALKKCRPLRNSPQPSAPASPGS